MAGRHRHPAGRPTATVVGWFVPAVILLAAFGVLDEAVQTFTPRRTGGDLYDWIADALGALTGALISLLMHRRALASPNRPGSGSDDGIMGRWQEKSLIPTVRVPPGTSSASIRRWCCSRSHRY